MTDPSQRFTSRVDDYERYRPGYPAGFLSAVKEMTGLTTEYAVVDIGSGTGISSLPFLENSNLVYGVEPNGPMRERAEKMLRGYSNFFSVNGSAEATTLPASIADCVVAAQAFHWFDRTRTRAEFARILKPGGWVVLVWNDRVTTSRFGEGYENLLMKHGTDYTQVNHRNITEDEIRGWFGVNGCRTKLIAHEQKLSWEAFRGRLFSTSYVPGPKDPGAASMLADLKDLFERFTVDGVVKMEYDTRMYVGRL
jgi:SAM-dependent methyltransferase